MNQKSVVLGLNGVGVARHGPILNHSEATGSRKVSRYLPDLRDTIFAQKYQTHSKNIETMFAYILIYFVLWPTPPN